MEVVVGVAVGVIVLFAIVVFVERSFVQNNVTTRRIQALHGATQSFELMQRDLRSALQVTPAPPATGVTASSYVTVRVWVPTSSGPVQHSVKYDCTAAGPTSTTHSCSRTDLTSNSTQTVIDRVSGDPSSVFKIRALVAPAALPVIDVDLNEEVEGATNPIALKTSVTPRNCIDGLPTGYSTCPG
jgi:hypothetical protein